MVLTTEELQSPWIQRAAIRLCEEIERNELETFSDGGIYHTAHALRRIKDALTMPVD